MDSTLGGSPGGRRQGWCKTVKLKIKLSLVAVGSSPLYQQNYYVKPKLELYYSSKVNTSGGLKVTSLQ